MTKVLQLTREAYGSHARHTALADFLELVTLSGAGVREADLARALEQDGIRIPRSPFDDSPRAGGSAYTQAARRVFSILEERNRVLETRWPFKLLDFRLTTTGGATASHPYIALLALTTAHAFNIKTSADPKLMFEGLVARCFGKRGARAATTGTSGEAGQGFVERATAVCKDIGLGFLPSNATLSNRAKDEKVDTLLHWDFGDGRSGRWTAVGQSTLAESGEWDKKLGEPSPNTWMRLIGDPLKPAAFLAVPHHIERWYWEKLLEQRQRVLVDRLRLALAEPELKTAETDLASEVLALEVEWR